MTETKASRPKHEVPEEARKAVATAIEFMLTLTDNKLKDQVDRKNRQYVLELLREAEQVMNDG